MFCLFYVTVLVIDEVHWWLRKRQLKREVIECLDRLEVILEENHEPCFYSLIL